MTVFSSQSVGGTRWEAGFLAQQHYKFRPAIICPPIQTTRVKTPPTVTSNKNHPLPLHLRYFTVFIKRISDFKRKESPNWPQQKDISLTRAKEIITSELNTKDVLRVNKWHCYSVLTLFHMRREDKIDHSSCPTVWNCIQTPCDEHSLDSLVLWN